MDSIVRISQVVWFTQEIASLCLNTLVATESYATSLEPFLDQNGALQAAGKLGNAALPYGSTFLILLYCKSGLAKITCRPETHL